MPPQAAHARTRRTVSQLPTTKSTRSLAWRLLSQTAYQPDLPAGARSRRGGADENVTRRIRFAGATFYNQIRSEGANHGSAHQHLPEGSHRRNRRRWERPAVDPQRVPPPDAGDRRQQPPVDQRIGGAHRAAGRRRVVRSAGATVEMISWLFAAAAGKHPAASNFYSTSSVASTTM